MHLRRPQLLARLRRSAAAAASPAALWPELNRTVVPHFAERCCVLLWAGPGELLLASDSAGLAPGWRTSAGPGSALAQWLSAPDAAPLGSPHPNGHAAPPEPLAGLLGPAWLAAPLWAAGRSLGLLGLSWSAPPDREALDLLDDLAASLALALAAAQTSELRHSQGLFQTLFENAPFGIAMADTDHSGLRANQAFADLVGYSIAELRERSVPDVTPPEDMAREQAFVEELLAGARTHYQIEKHYRHRDGGLIPIRLTGMLMRDQAGAPVMGIAMAEDRRAQLAAEQALRASEALYRTLVEDMDDILVRWTPERRRIFVNRAYCQFFGKSSAELLATPVGQLTHPDDQHQVAGTIAGLSPQQPIISYVDRLRRPDGSYAYFAWLNHGIFDEQGRLVEIQSVGRDVSLQRALEEQRDWLVAILEATPDLVGYMDLEARVQYLNRAGRRWFGISPDEDLSQMPATLRTWQPPWADQFTREQVIPATLRDGSWQGESVIVDADGHQRPIWQIALALRDREGELARIATIAHDMTELKRATGERMALERKMLEAQRLESLGVLSAGIAHEFNNILTSVMGNAELIQLSLPDQSELDELTGQILAAVQRATDLTRQIAAYAGRGRFQMLRVPVGPLIAEVAELARASAARGCSIQLQLDPDLPELTIDPQQFRQMLLNLLINAAEADEREGATIEVGAITRELSRAALSEMRLGIDRPAGRYLGISVRDYGSGMDEATLARIFDPFFSTRFAGRGLGLPAVQGIVGSYGGALSVVSAPGAGTTVMVWLPVAPDTAPGLAPADAARGADKGCYAG